MAASRVPMSGHSLGHRGGSDARAFGEDAEALATEGSDSSHKASFTTFGDNAHHAAGEASLGMSFKGAAC